MTWEFNNQKPIYSQLVEQIKIRIIIGAYPCGGKLPSVRDMATEAEVNPNTMQKALSELEKDGLVFSQRTTGRFITEDKKMLEDLKQHLATAQINIFLSEMSKLGFSEVQTLEMVKKSIKL